MPRKNSFQTSNTAILASDARRENLDAIATFHITLATLLLGQSPLPTYSISDLETELISKTMQIGYQREALERKIEQRRARVHQDILPFLG
jgi:hypothetical protein